MVRKLLNLSLLPAQNERLQLLWQLYIKTHLFFPPEGPSQINLKIKELKLSDISDQLVVIALTDARMSIC